MGSVNWQNNETYQFIKQREKDTGISYAAENSMRGLDCHSVWGVLGVNFAQGATNMALNKFGAGADTGSATDVKGKTSLMSEAGGILAKFDKAIADNDNDAITTHLGALKKLKNEHPNDNRIAKVYNTAFDKFKNNLKFQPNNQS